MVLHVFAQPNDEVQSLFKEQVRQGSRDVTPISKELASELLNKRWDRVRSSTLPGVKQHAEPRLLDH
jgi:hypothetical protein